MARLRFKDTVPPRGWFYIQRETNLRIVGESLSDLAVKVAEHRRYKGLPNATKQQASLDIERQICSRLGRRECVAEGVKDEWQPVNDVPLLSLSAILGFSRAMLEWIATGKELVSKEESDRRASICKGCQLNNPVVGCKCSLFYKLVNKSIPFERRDAALGICGVCSCSLQAKVNLPMSVIKASNEQRDLSYPSFCWQADDPEAKAPERIGIAKGP